jgi:lipoic acid synthetase
MLMIKGLGETDAEVEETLKDLKEAGVDCLTIGQYLKPSKRHMPVTNFVHPEKFKFWEERGVQLFFFVLNLTRKGARVSLHGQWATGAI